MVEHQGHFNQAFYGSKESADARRMGEFNRNVVLNLIRQEGTISRAEIAQRTKLSRSAVSNIIDRLLGEGLVQDTGMGESNGGRRPIMLKLNYAVGQVIGLEIGTNYLLSILTDLEGNILAESNQPFCVEMPPEEGLRSMVEHLRKLTAQCSNRKIPVLGVGVGVPAPLDYTNGMLIQPPLMPNWSFFPLRQRLSQALNLPVKIENDANLAALAEKWHGVGLVQEHLAYIKISTGIGCGLVLDGKPYRGSRGSAGEIGHIVIVSDGSPCRCGSYGCLESVASIPAIINRVRLAILAGRVTALQQLSGSQTLSARLIVEAANKGDQLAIDVLENAGRYIGIALANLINLFNPGMIIVGSEDAELNEIILKPIRETVEKHSLTINYTNTKIVTGQLGTEAIVKGAATMMTTSIFKQLGYYPPQLAAN